jgi:hypothetical protein
VNAHFNELRAKRELDPVLQLRASPESFSRLTGSFLLGFSFQS